MSYRAMREEAERLAREGKQVVLGGHKQNYDDRFVRPADAELIRRLNSLPVGSLARVRSVEFRKVSRWRWANDFRSGMTARMVASVLGEETVWEIVPAEPSAK